MKSLQPRMAGRGRGGAFEDHDLAPPAELREQIARDVARQSAIVRADEAQPRAGGRAGHEIEQRNARGIEGEDRVVDGGLMHRREDDRVRPRRDRARDQRDLLANVVRLLGHVVRGGGAEPRRHPVGSEAGGLIRRIGAVLGEDGNVHLGSGF